MGKRGESLTGETVTGGSTSTTTTTSGVGGRGESPSGEALTGDFAYPGTTSSTGDGGRGESPTGESLTGGLAYPQTTTSPGGGGGGGGGGTVNAKTGESPTGESPTGGAEFSATASSQWLVDGVGVRVVGVVLTSTTLELDIRARTTAERDVLSRLDSEAGALSTRELADGTTQAVDRAGGDNTFDLTPPSRLSPPRTSRPWVVDDVSRNRLSADTQAIAASVSLAATDTRQPVTGYQDATNSNRWRFDFQGGRIVTSRVSELEQAATTQLQLVLSPEQAELFETTVAATAGAVVSTVPDGTSYSRDTTPTDRQTVTVTPPVGASDPAIEAGDYVVTGWESIGRDGASFRVVVELSSRYEDV